MRNELDGFVGHDATDERVVTMLNEALERYGDLNPKDKRKQAFAVVAGSFEIEFRNIFGGVRQVQGVYRNGISLTEVLPAVFAAAYPNAEYASEGEPLHYTKLEPTKILLSRPVSVSAAAGTWTATLGVAPDALNHAVPNAIPDLPKRLHPFIVKYAIWIASAGYAMNADQAQTVEAFRVEALSQFRDYSAKRNEVTLVEVFPKADAKRFDGLDLS
jgi:hypothetical protein